MTMMRVSSRQVEPGVRAWMRDSSAPMTWDRVVALALETGPSNSIFMGGKPEMRC